MSRLVPFLLTLSLVPAVASDDVADPAATSTQIAQAGARQFEYRVHRHASPRATVVLENGLGLTLETWRHVWPALDDCCQWLAYNRAGIGRSEPYRADEGSPAPGPGSEAAEDLQRLLQALDLPPPYVLVGHSLGGQHVQRFAQRHPDQVAGLVLVDALPIGVARPYDDFPWLTRVGLRLFVSAPLRRELAAIHPMGEQLLNQPRFAGPMVRLVAMNDAPKPEGLFRDLMKGIVYAEDFGIWSVSPDLAEARMDDLYPQAERRALRGSHRLQEEVPQQVVDAINAVLGRIDAPTVSARPTEMPAQPIGL